MRNFSKPDLWCLIMTCKKRNATTGKGCYVFLAWSGFSCKRKTWVPKWDEKKQANNQCQGFLLEGSLSYEFPKNQPIFTTNKVPQELLAPQMFFDVENKSRTSATTSLNLGGKEFFLGRRFTRQSPKMAASWSWWISIANKITCIHDIMFQQFSTKKNLWFSGWQFWDQIHPW